MGGTWAERPVVSTANSRVLFGSSSIQLARLGSGAEAATGPRIHQTQVGGRQVTFSARGEAPGTVGILLTNFVLDPSGILRSSYYISVGTTLMLVVSLVARMTGFARPTSDAAAGALVAVPGIFTAYLFGTREHPFAVRAARFVRTLILASASLSFLAAAYWSCR